MYGKQGGHVLHGKFGRWSRCEL
jgi:hypothetical protein